MSTRVRTAGLSASARELIKWWSPGRVTIAGYVRAHSDDGRWHGDTCGCPDDRCIGYHHDELDGCGCLPAELARLVQQQLAGEAAAPIWATYRAAVDAVSVPAGSDAQAAAVELWRQAAAAWVRETQGAGVVSFSLDTLVDGRAGISIRTKYNDRDWLVWEAPTVTPTAVFSPAEAG